MEFITGLNNQDVFVIVHCKGFVSKTLLTFSTVAFSLVFNQGYCVQELRTISFIMISEQNICFPHFQ